MLLQEIYDKNLRIDRKDLLRDKQLLSQLQDTLCYLRLLKEPQKIRVSITITIKALNNFQKVIGLPVVDWIDKTCAETLLSAILDDVPEALRIR